MEFLQEKRQERKGERNLRIQIFCGWRDLNSHEIFH